MATRTIGTDIKLTGEKEFNDGMKAINANLKNLRTDMAAVSSEFDGNADSVEALSAKQKILEESVDQHKEKVNALRQMYEKQVAAYGENSHGADKYRQALNQAIVAMNKETAALTKNAAALETARSGGETYIPLTRKLADAVKKLGEAFGNLKNDISDAIHKLPVFAEMADAASASAKALAAGGKGAGVVLKGLGTAAGGAAKGVAKSVGLITAASAATAAAAGVLGVTALTKMAGMAKEAAEAAKAAKEAGETLTESQEQWLAYSGQLEALDSSVSKAKAALGGVLLPVLSDLSEEGAAFLNDFAADMEAAGSDTGKQTEVLTAYITKGAKLIKSKLPEYIESAKMLISGLGAGIAESGPEILDMILDLCMDLLDQVIDFAPELAAGGIALIDKLIETLSAKGPDLMVSAVQIVTDLVTGLAQAAPNMIPAAANLVVQLILALAQAAPQLLLAGLELVYGIISGIFDGLGNIVDASDDIIAAIVQAFEDKAQSFLDIGSAIVERIKQGISDAWAGIVSWFRGKLDDLKATISVQSSGSSADGSHASGLDYVPFDGYIARLHKGEMVLTSQEASAYRGGRSGGRQQKIVNLTIHATSLTQADIAMLLDLVDQKLGEAIA